MRELRSIKSKADYIKMKKGWKAKKNDNGNEWEMIFDFIEW